MYLLPNTTWVTSQKGTSPAPLPFSIPITVILGLTKVTVTVSEFEMDKRRGLTYNRSHETSPKRHCKDTG